MTEPTDVEAGADDPTPVPEAPKTPIRSLAELIQASTSDLVPVPIEHLGGREMYFAVLGYDKMSEILDMSDGDEETKRRMLPTAIAKCVCSPDGQLLFPPDAEGLIEVHIQTLLEMPFLTLQEIGDAVLDVNGVGKRGEEALGEG